MNNSNNNKNNKFNNEYNSIIFYKIFHNKILRQKIFEYVHIFNIASFNLISYNRHRLTCSQLKNKGFNQILFYSFYTKLAIKCINEEELFDLLETIELPPSLNRLVFSFNNINTEFEIIISQNNIPSTLSPPPRSNLLKALPDYIEELNFQISSYNSSPSTQLFKEIESRILPESSKILITPNEKHNYKSTFIQIPYTLSISSLKLGSWFKNPLSYGWIPINQRLYKLILSKDFNNKIQVAGLNDSFHLRELQFGDAFNQEIDTNILPNTLETIIFGQSFNKPLKKDGILPKSLKRIIFKKNSYFNSDFSFKNLKELNTVVFGQGCNEVLSESLLPSESLTKLIVYNLKQIKNFKSSWFKNLQVLKAKTIDYDRRFGDYILDKKDYSVNPVKSIPSSVKVFRIEGNITFDQDIVSKVTQLSVFPTRFLRDLGFKFKNNQSIRQLKLYLNCTPLEDQLEGALNLESLAIYGRFHQNLENIKFPSSLKSLKIYTNFDRFIRLSHNSSIQILELGKSYQQKFLENELPSSLTYLKIDSISYHEKINKNILPPSLLALSVTLKDPSQLESLPDKLESLDISFNNFNPNFDPLTQLPPSITLLSLHHNLKVNLSSKWLPNQIKNIIIQNGYFDYENEMPQSLDSIYTPYLNNISTLLNDKYIVNYIKIITNSPSTLFNKLTNLNLNY